MSTNKATVFTGTGTALITPFKDGKVDYFALTSLIERQITAGVDAIIICGTTGESSTLLDDEHRCVIEHAVTVAAGRVPIVAGTGSNDTDYAVSLSKDACRSGADGLLVVTPYYNKTNDAGLVKHYYAIADACDKPVILYNVPSRTGMNISLKAYKALAEHPNIVATKEASGDISAIMRLMDACGDSLRVYSGNDDQALPLIACGAIGVISTVSNVIPGEFSSLIRTALNGNFGAANLLRRKYAPLMDAMFTTVNPIPVKAACSSMGLCTPEIRLPLAAMEGEELEKLHKVMKDAHVL